MYVGRDFDPIDPGEEEFFQLDFAREMSAGLTIVSTTWEAEVAERSIGEDATPAARVIEAALVSGTKSIQKIGTCVAGVTYMLKANVVLSNGEKKSLWAHTDCTEPG